MVDSQPTRIGRVRHVLGTEVTVVLDDDLAGVSPIFRGQLQSIGQIGSLVRIPQGLVDLVAQVSLLGISELTPVPIPTGVVQTGERWLQVQLLGEIGRTMERFTRGVGSFPGIDDAVHFMTQEDLHSIFPIEGAGFIRVGRLASSDEISICLDVRKLVTRHSAVVGSTGAGKTSMVASLLQKFAQGNWPSANIVIFDPHGEYASAFGATASVRSVLPRANAASLEVPYWALPAEDILLLFAKTKGGPTTASRFTELVTLARRKFAAESNWLQIEESAVTADTPIPFDLHNIWYQLDGENRETWQAKGDPSSVCIDVEGKAEELRPTSYRPYGAGSAAPFKGQYFGVHGSIPELLRLGLLDTRLNFFKEPMGISDTSDPLVPVMQNWLGGELPISILDFSGVSAQATELAIGVILNLIFEVALRTDANTTGIGRTRPVLIVLEEAHRYLAEGALAIARNTVNRIAREGRKYGIGLMLVTQRPSELPDTALSQVGTLIALRLTNSGDQSRVQAALPDSVSGLAAILPSLRTGEAVITGEGIILPVRVLVDKPNPVPAAEDPSLESWQLETSTPALAPAIAAWRATYNVGL
jgi:hypothetical protein